MRSNGGFVVLAPPALRVEEQDWSELTIDAYSHADAAAASQTTVVLRARGSGSTERTSATVISFERTDTAASFSISASDDRAERAWVRRLHLPHGARVLRARLDGAVLPDEALVHIAPATGTSEAAAEYFPFGGKGAAPPRLAGNVAELLIPRSASSRSVTLEYY